MRREQLMVGFRVLSGALKTPPRAVKLHTASDSRMQIDLRRGRSKHGQFLDGTGEKQSLADVNVTEKICGFWWLLTNEFGWKNTSAH